MRDWRHDLKVLKRKVRLPFEWLGIGLGALVLSNVPHRVLLGLCDFGSAVFYRFDRRGRELSRANLRQMLGVELTPRREDLILRRAYRNMARTIGHIFWTSRAAAHRAAAVGELSPASLAILAAHRPGITVSGHVGNWEILSQLVSLQGRRIVSVAKPIGTPRMTELLMKSRRSIGQDIVPAAGAFKHLMQGLKDGADIGLLVDQYVDPKDGGVWVRFFGRPICVSVAPAFLCAKTHAPILVAWSRPLKAGRYRCEFIKPFAYEKGMDIWGRTQAVIATLESVIRRHPSIWVLNYRYWNDKPSPAALAQLEEREKKEQLTTNNSQLTTGVGISS